MKKINLYSILVVALIISTTLLIVACKSNIILNNNQTKPNNNTTKPLTGSAAEDISKNVDYDYNMKYDTTTDSNIRYVGGEPNNYVLFNDERWRIIGVFNNVETENGKKQTMLKIMRSESIGKLSWDSSTKDVNDIYSGLGVNDWSTSDLMYLLNYGSYWNSNSGDCYVGKNNEKETCNFNIIGLSDEAKSLIEKVKWNITPTNTTTLKASTMYKTERKEKSWVGYVGLISPSDYGFASYKCFDNTALNNYDIEACNYTNYIYKIITNDKTNDLWTIMSDYKVNNKVYTVGKVMKKANTYDQRSVYPTLYLKAGVKIESGTGTYIDPYILTE